MKIKSSFITNSSSSSFLVVFDEVPKNVEEMKKALFGTGKRSLKNPFSNFMGEPTYPAIMVANRVFNEMRVANESELEELFADYYSNETIEEYMGAYTKEAWDEYSKKVLEGGKSKLAEFAKTHDLSKVRAFTFSDNNGEFETVLEHGDVFENLEYIRISQH